MQLPPSVYKALAHRLSRGSQPLDTNLPSPQVAGLQNKANFSLHQPCLLSIVFWATSSWAWFSVTKGLGGKLERQAQPLLILLRLGYLVFKSHVWWWGLGVGGGGGVVLQSSLTLGDPLDGSLPGFSVHDIFQARIMEWVALSFSTVIHIKQINFTKGRRSPVSSVTRHPPPTTTHMFLLRFWTHFTGLSLYTVQVSSKLFPPYMLSYCRHAQLCLFSTPCSSVLGTFQARILEWVAISSSRGSSHPRDWTIVSCVSCIGRWIFYHWAKSFSSLYVEWSIKQLGLSLWFSIAMHGIMLCKLSRKRIVLLTITRNLSELNDIKTRKHVTTLEF